MTMNLYYWPSALKWGLPSFDMRSLHVLSYIKFSGAEDVGLHPTLQSSFSKENKVLPSLATPNDGLIENPENIIKYLKENGFDPDKTFPVDVVNNVLPFSALILERLLPAVVSTIWIDNVNFKEVAHGAYARSCRYPFNFITPNMRQKEEENFLKEFKYLSEVDSKAIEQIQHDALSALNLISEYLGEKDYLLGKTPSSLDALLFSTLAPLLRMPLAGSKLQNHLKGCPNICQYISRILQKFFQQELVQSQNSSATTSSTTSDNSDVSGVVSNWTYDWVFPLTVATIAMLSYAANAGMLHGRV